MTNKERKDYLEHIAEKRYKEMQESYKEGDWNMVIRNAQESQECYIKATLKYMNIEFPKEHDIGGYFEKILIERAYSFNKEDLVKIKILSKGLARKRAPAYYGEVFYSQEEAEKAKEGVKFIRDFVRNFLKFLRLPGEE